MSAALRAPFPWFGGKRRVADVVWRAFGPNIANYVEPFAGSLAVLLGRPGGAGKIETVNDRDRYLANFWRAVTAFPELVAEAADWPVNEADLHARHKWLVNQAEFRERMHTDPGFCDVKIAGWWVWGICQWIGGGWCVEPNNHKHPRLDGIGKGIHADAGHPKEQLPDLAVTTQNGMASGRGVHSRSARSRGADRANESNRPELAGAGKGIHSERGRRQSEADWRKRPELDGTSPGRGVHSDTAHESKPPHEWEQRPHMSGTSDGVGVHRKLPNLAVGGAQGDAAGRGMLSEAAVQAYSSGRRPQLSSAGQGINVPSLFEHLPSLGNDRGLNGVIAPPCVDWFRALQTRLRRVRVACGDWTRVLGDSVLGKGKNVGGRRPCAVFLDPPYSHEFRDPYLYSEDDPAIAAKVRDWALEHGDDPDLRIALCGYAGEHEMPKTWTEHAWKAARGYAGEGNDNRERERIWFSPHCLAPVAQTSLFAEVGT